MFDVSSSELALASLESLFAVPTTLASGEKFLRVQISPTSTALLAVEHVAAVLTVAISDILPVPHMPDYVLGIYNWRGEMLWLVDLGFQVGFSSLLQLGTDLSGLMAVVIQVDAYALGLVVSQVHDIEQHDPRQLQSPSVSLFPPRLLPFVQGYLTHDQSIALNAAAILQDPRLQMHCPQA